MDITSVLTIIITVIGAVATGVLIPYIRSRTTAAQRESIAAWVRIAVEAAEQIYSGTGRGGEKKAYVWEYLNKIGLTCDADTVDAMIEAAVYSLPEAITAPPTTAETTATSPSLEPAQPAAE